MTASSAVAVAAEEPAGPRDAGNLFIRRLSISGMLSFGPQGIDLPMEPLNVLIGPNGSGKSNFIEALALLQAAPRDLSAPVRRPSGISEWLWKGDDAPGAGVVDAVVSYPRGSMHLRHVLEIGQQGERFEVRDESIENESPYPGQTRPYFYYNFQRGNPVINDFGDQPTGQRRRRELRKDTVIPEESILSQRGDDPEHYPELNWLRRQYSQIRLFRNWEFGPNAKLRQPPRADEPSSFLMERGENLALMLSSLRGPSRQKFVKALQQLYDGIEDFQVEVRGGGAELFVVERGAGERYVSASRLSDGTLRYLTLAATLLDPDPPSLVVIEEPELGLHPDVVLGVGEMLVEASTRMQLVVTTHSRVLINALENDLSSVVVCEKRDGQSHMNRLKPEKLEEFLENYSLGSLWSMGRLGGNRW